MMEKIFSKPPIYLAIVWLAAKIILFNLYPEWDTFMIGACVNVLFIFALILINLRSKTGTTPFLSQFKLILQAVSFYILLIGIGIFVYYQKVDPGYITDKRIQSLSGMEEAIDKEGGWEVFREKNPSIKQKNIADFIAYKTENPPGFLSSQGQALLSVLALLLLAIFWSLIFLIVSRKALEQQGRMTGIKS